MISITAEVEVLGLDEVIEVITENLRLKSLSQHFEESDKCISSEVKIMFWPNV